MPPVAVFAREVILVHCTRGEGELRRNVLQVYDKGGDLLAEHDEIHPDPIWPANYVRQQVADGKWAPAAGGAAAGGV